jgi:arylsulfatase A-like enzyme
MRRGRSLPASISVILTTPRTSRRSSAGAPAPGFLPDAPEVRSDLADYAFEIEWYDRQLGRVLRILEDRSELDNTLVVVTADNGIAVPAREGQPVRLRDPRAPGHPLGRPGPAATRRGGLRQLPRLCSDVSGGGRTARALRDDGTKPAPGPPVRAIRAGGPGSRLRRVRHRPGRPHQGLSVHTKPHSGRKSRRRPSRARLASRRSHGRLRR